MYLVRLLCHWYSHGISRASLFLASLMIAGGNFTLRDNDCWSLVGFRMLADAGSFPPQSNQPMKVAHNGIESLLLGNLQPSL
jgi:hypothetical protein